MRSLVTPLVSGLWKGFYEQSRRQYGQEMTLEFADGIVRGDGRDDLGTFTIEGEYRTAQGELRLGWIKTYDSAHSVLYLGRLDGPVIAGAWSIPPWDNGGFELSPATASTKTGPRP